MTNINFENMWKIMESVFDLNENVPIDLRCIICDKLMIKACNGPCGCRYCCQCITNYLNGIEKFCPGKSKYCNNQYLNINRNIQIDQPTNIKISSIIVKCPNKFCPYRNELITINDHICICNRRSIICPFVNIGCNNINMTQDNIDEHCMTENYSHSQLLINWINACKIEITSLNNKLEILGNRDKMLQMAAEKNSDIIGKLQTNESLKSDAIKLLNEEIKSLKKDKTYLQKQINDLNINFDRKQADMQSQIKLQNQEIQELKNLFKKSDNNQENLWMKIDDIKYKSGISTTKMDQCQADIQQIGKQSRSLTKKLSILQIHMNKDNGQLVWIIENWNEVIRQAKNETITEIRSESFYSEKFGYKLCLCIYPNGFGDVKGVYTCVLLCIMPSCFDTILQWPFRRDVTVSLVNQNTSLIHSSKIIKHQPFTDNGNFNQPKDIPNIVWNHPFLISLDELSTNIALCQNNRINIKCSVEAAK